MNTNDEKERDPMRAAFLKLFKYPMSDDFESETFERGWKAGRAALMAESEPVYQFSANNGQWIDIEKPDYDKLQTMLPNEHLRTRILYTAPQTEPKDTGAEI